jgi:putative glutamine amidotransferase
MKPIIGISVDCKQEPEDAQSEGKLTLNWNYAKAVSESGGIPILIPPTADMDVIAELIDGWLIPGGRDIDASEFGEENHPMVTLQDPARFEAESRMYHAASPEMPVFGICYGCQLINVIRGGSLHQHLPDVPGRVVHTGGVLQDYTVESGSKLASLTRAKDISGKSYHHQGLNKIGEDLAVSAYCDDRTVEAIEATDRPWLIGLQWHPERTFNDPKTRRIFDGFIAAAKEYKARKSDRSAVQ